MAIMGDARFGQWAQPGFGASLSASAPSPSAAPGVLPAPGDTDPSASASFNSRGSDPNPGQDHFQQAGVYGGSWSPGAGGMPSIALAEGGAIPDGSGGQDTGDQQPAQADPFDLVQQALSYGRQKLGLPQSFFGGSDTGDSAAPATPSQSFAEGGAVGGDDDQAQEGMIPDQQDQQDQQPEQGAQGSQGPDPKAAMAYLQGAGAMSADQALALEKNVDPSGTMDPNVRKMKAVQAAGSPDKAFSLMQHYRQKFNAYNAFAKTAAQGTPQKPADLNASARAATQAYQHLPDGNDIRFNPVQGGMHVAIRNVVPPSGGQRQQGAQKKFALGGAVGGDEDDPQADTQMADAGEAQDQGILPDNRGEPARDLRPLRRIETKTPTDKEFGENVSKAVRGVMPDGTAKAGEAKGDDSDGPVKQALGGKSPHQMVRDFVLSPAQWMGWLAKDGQADSVLENGAASTLEKAVADATAPAQGSQQPEQDPEQDPEQQEDPAGGAQPQPQPEPQGQQQPEPQGQQQPASRTMARTSSGQDLDITPAGGVQQPSPGEHPFRRSVPPGTDPGIAKTAAQIFPYVGQNRQRLEWIAQQTDKQADRSVKVDVAKQQGVNMTARAEIAAGARRYETDAHTKRVSDHDFAVAQRTLASHKSNEEIARLKNDGLWDRMVEQEAGKNGRTAAMVNPSVLNSPKKMQGAMDVLHQPAPRQPQPDRQNQPQQQPAGKPGSKPTEGTGPAPTSVPPPGMKYQQNSTRTRWRLVPVQQ